MEPGDFLMPDLSLADQHPEQLLEGDPRREHFIARATLEQIVTFIEEVKGHDRSASDLAKTDSLAHILREWQEERVGH